MSEQTSKPVIVLPPPVLKVSVLSNKYEMVIEVRWGTFEKFVKVDKETYNFNDLLVQELNKALLEGSETNPYLTK